MYGDENWEERQSSAGSYKSDNWTEGEFPYPVGIDHLPTIPLHPVLTQYFESVGHGHDQCDEVENTWEDGNVVRIAMMFFVDSTDRDVIETVGYHVGEGGESYHTAQAD